MSRLIIILGLLFAQLATADDLALQGFNDRFNVVRNAEGKVTMIKLKKVVKRFTLKPFIEQLKSDLSREQASFKSMSDFEKEAEVDELLSSMGYNSYLVATQGSEEAQKFKESLLNIKNINVQEAFATLAKEGSFWAEFESKLNEAFNFIDPTIMTNLDDARFFYKRQVTYRVVVWALEQAKKRFSNVPVLNIASFVIVRVHDMMLEQRHFHHNMLLHYFNAIPESKLEMTKEEVDRAVSSIFEYRIEVSNFMESNKAAQDWLNYGMNKYYSVVRATNARATSHKMKKLNFAFAEDMDAKKIYHMQANAHMFSQKPALAFDHNEPNKIKRNRALMNLAGVALGFINMPGWLKSNVDSFIKSMYVNQVRLEGALVGHFETANNTEMIRQVYNQRANFYILR